MRKEISRREMLAGASVGLLAAAPAAKRKPAPHKDAHPAAAAPAPQPAALPAPTPKPADPYAHIEPAIYDALERSRTPGLSLAIVEGHKIVYTKGYGLANLETRNSVTPDTMFLTASLTKPVFAFAALKACDRGDIGLDTPILSYVSSSEVSHDPRAQRITARDVLAHMSGLPNWVDGRRPMKMEFDPGEKFSYSSEAYNCLKKVVEARSGKSLNDVLVETVLEPFGLANSAFVWRDEYEPKIALGYDWDGTIVRDRSKPKEASASSSMHTTPRDYAKFMIASLGNGDRTPDQLDYITERMMLSPQVRLSDPFSWGLGWALHLSDGGDRHWHMGDARGYMNYAMLCRETGDGMVVMTNSRHGLRVCHAVARELFDNQDQVFQFAYDYFYEGKLPQWPTA